MRPAPERLIGPVLVRSAFEHGGAAKALVHRLKYEAVWGVAERLAMTLVPLLPADATALIPVPRVRLRRLRYGVDPAVSLARALADRTGLPLVNALVPMWWAGPRAGPAEQHRGTQRFRGARVAPPRSVLVDDVVTTGTTVLAAARVSGVRHAVSVTAGHSALTRPRGDP